MEEKEITFNIISDGNKVPNITSDIDDCPDYLTVEEKITVIHKLLSDVFSDIVNKLDSDGAEEDTISMVVGDIMSNLVQLVINDGNNIFRLYTGDKPELLASSVCVYEVEEIINGINLYMPTFSLHSEELNVLDPLQAVNAFMFDVLGDLLMTKSKNSVKQILNATLNALQKDCNDFIAEYDT